MRILFEKLLTRSTIIKYKIYVCSELKISTTFRCFYGSCFYVNDRYVSRNFVHISSEFYIFLKKLSNSSLYFQNFVESSSRNVKEFLKFSEKIAPKKPFYGPRHQIPLN